MAELATIARPYAEALFQVASSSDADRWIVSLDEMAQAASHPDVKSMSNNPRLTSAQVSETFLALLKSSASREAVNLVNTLAAAHRLMLLPSIAQQFTALVHARNGAMDAQIASAFPMSEEEIGKILPALERRFGRRLIPSVEVDPSLIGGITVTVGDQVFDASVKASLQRLNTAMTA